MKCIVLEGVEKGWQLAKYKSTKLTNLNYLTGLSLFPGLAQIAKDSEDLEGFLDELDHFTLSAIDVDVLLAIGISEKKIANLYNELIRIRKRISKVKKWDLFKQMLEDNSPLDISLNVAKRMPMLDRRDP